MASDSPSPLVVEHAFPLRVGCAAQGCAVMFLAVVGSIAAATLTAGYMKFVNGDVPLGLGLCVISLLGLPGLILAPIMLLSGLREVLNPECLYLTSNALILPPRLRGTPPDAQGNPIPNAPGPQPEVIPFTAIRKITCGTGPTGRLRIDHDLAPTTLVLLEYLMTPRDYESLEKFLRAGIPTAFTAPAKDPGTGG
ncbi:MAG: hypothetical protein C0467_01955 [Planctomycetaceae bacterium]|nr:hypothetical protein [Planctomycetaceae bacterium]